MDVREQSTVVTEPQSSAPPKKEPSSSYGFIENTIAFKGMDVDILEHINQINRLGKNKLYPAITPSWKEPTIHPEYGTTLTPNSPHEGSVKPDEAIALQVLAKEISALFIACGEDSPKDLALMEAMRTKFGITLEYEHDAIAGMADFRDCLKIAAHVRDGLDKENEYDEFEEPLDSDNQSLGERVVKAAIQRIKTQIPESLKKDSNNRLDDKMRTDARIKGAQFASAQYREVLKLAQQTPR